MTIDETVQTIERLLPQGHLTKIQKIVLQQTWQGRSYLEIAREFGYDAGYIKDTGAKLWQQISATLGEKVTKQNFKGVVNRAVWRETGDHQMLNHTTQIAIGEGKAIDVSIFYNCIQELTTLQTWIVQDQCRLSSLLIQFLSQQQDIELPNTVSGKLARLIALLESDTGIRRDRRCKDCTAIVRQDALHK